MTKEKLDNLRTKLVEHRTKNAEVDELKALYYDNMDGYYSGLNEEDILEEAEAYDIKIENENDEVIEQILQSMKWDKIELVLEQLKWYWRSENTIPSRVDLIKTGRSLLVQALHHKDENARVSTGGLVASKQYYKSTGNTILQLDFTVDSKYETILREI